MTSAPQTSGNHPEMRTPPEPAQRGDVRDNNKEIVPMAIEFKNPPGDARRTNGNIREVAATLSSRPGEWAFIGRMSASVATNIKRAQSAAFAPAGSFEAVSRNNDGKKADIYARYVGENGEHA